MSTYSLKENKKILNVNELTNFALTALLEDVALAVVVRNFFPDIDSQNMSQRILQSNAIEPYTHELFENQKVTQKYFGVDRIGTPFNSTYNYEKESVEKENYYKNVSVSANALKEYAKPNLAPNLVFKNKLDKAFPHGSQIASFEGRSMLFGICRITNSKSSHLGADEPHFDALPEKYAKFDTQIAANIYMQVPQIGGELEIWDIPQLPASYEIPSNWKNDLGPATVTIKPELGDLILFNCRKPHLVKSFSGQERISVQFFMGVNKNKPIQLWN